MRAPLVVLVLSTWLSGCSWVFVRAPPSTSEVRSAPRGAPVRCTSSRVAPVLDTVGIGVQVARIALAVAADDSQYAGAPLSRGADIAIGAGLTAVLTAAAWYGYENTARCSELQEAASRDDGRRDWGAPKTAAHNLPDAPQQPFGDECSADSQCSDLKICEHGWCVTPVHTTNGVAP